MTHSNKMTRKDFLYASSSIALLSIAGWPKANDTRINSIIDLHHKSSIKIKSAKEAGVSAIIFKGTEGVSSHDPKYHLAKKEAKELGLLWGSFHFSNNGDVTKQVSNYLSYVKPEGNEVICLDFEHNKGKEMSLKQAEQFVQLVKGELGRFPMLYGGAWMREQIGKNKNEILSQCPLWYRRYASSPKELPTQVWPTYTLWQYTDGEIGGNPKTVNGITCDRSFFQGTEDDLKNAWPFTKRS